MIQNNYRGLKLLEQVLKVVESVFGKLLRVSENVDPMQLGLCLAEEHLQCS